MDRGGGSTAVAADVTSGRGVRLNFVDGVNFAQQLAGQFQMGASQVFLKLFHCGSADDDTGDERLLPDKTQGHLRGCQVVLAG